ncbi:MAG: glycosyltransferase family 2 protein [Panacagrimonas sp.]
MEFSDESKVSVVVTSCGRFDLLKLTLESFDRFNTAPIHSVFVTEDSGDEAVRAAIPTHWTARTQVFVNRPARGQLASIDLAYSRVSTPLVFHLEDDWEFYRPGFIEDSEKLLAHEPLAFTVWLRSFAHDLRVHAPHQELGAPASHDGVRHHRLQSDKPDWSGFTFNPGLRRLSDYNRAAPYTPYETEKKLSRHYGGLGYHALILESDAVLHTGWGRHVPRPVEASKKSRRRTRQRVATAIMLVLSFFLGAVAARLL